MSMGGTASYATTTVDVPSLVRAAVADAERLGFPLCCRPEIGRLLHVLAAGVPAGGRIGETGTGTGAGLAWMVCATRPDVSFVSIELDATLADAARARFVDHPNVTVVTGDAAAIGDHGPFDLLVLDGGPGSGKGDHPPADPDAVLVPGGVLTVDDFTPMTAWPPRHEGRFDEPRAHWLTHPSLHSTEIRVADDLAVLVCRRLNRR